MNFNSYKNSLPYGEYKSPEREAWAKEEGRLSQLFFDDMAEDLGYTNHPKRSKFETICWQKGHSSGYSEVYNVALDFIDLIN
jgi:hypothetical protein